MFIKVSANKSINTNCVLIASKFQYSSDSVAILLKLTDRVDVLIEPDFVTLEIQELFNLYT